MILIGVITLVPTVVIPFYFSAESQFFFAFLIPSLSSIAAGLAACIVPIKKIHGRGFSYNLRRASLTVLFAWFYGTFLGAIPFLFLGEINYIQCLFESASGWSTAGLSVLNVETLPHVFLFHRSFMQFCGGLGFVLVMITLIQNRHAMSLYSFEGHDQVTPSVVKTARTIFALYMSIFLVGALLYIICGMNPFDSVIHSMSALSTGGFSTKAGSIGEYNSVAYEAVTIVIMLLGMTNFAVLVLLVRRKFRQAGKVSEVRLGGIILGAAAVMAVLGLYFSSTLSFGDSVRHGVFNTVSFMSTTGYTSMEHTALPPFVFLLMFILVFIGGGSGSTSSGLKLNRVYLLLRGAGLNLKNRMSPKSQVSVAYYYNAQGKTVIDDALLKDTYAFLALYLITFFTTALLLTLTAGASITDALFESASLITAVGLSSGIFDAAANAGTLFVGILGMLIARLEITILVTGFFSVAGTKR